MFFSPHKAPIEGSLSNVLSGFSKYLKNSLKNDCFVLNSVNETCL